MSTSDTPVPREVTLDEAMAALSDDPAAYNLPGDASDDTITKRKEQAAMNLVLGSRANAAYWNSRSELEQFVARATGHGQVVAPPTEDTPTGVAAPTEPGGVVEGTGTPVASGEVPQTTGAGTEPALPDGSTGDESPEDRLRAQLRAANIEPEV